ncbi:hypothetical protein INT45_012847 [Circinella minor]|uniref:PHD-type domain-containing protein n=1 Tax=Circinella minor TaxID=1195481 RepID=A0A8H7S635_9FUNG|nr:hypothetical protein INT45_012847 [Circinella minor]
MSTSTSRLSTTTTVDTNNHTLLDTTSTPLLISTDPSLALSTLGISDPYLAKPKIASADARHECGSALLPITTTSQTSSHLGIAGPCPTTTTWQLLLYYHQQLVCPPVVKDDVFLGPADNESVITVNSSTDSTYTTSSNSNNNTNNAPSVGNWAPTPCLSPVTSPSDFLCNHEPLFDGIEDLQQQQKVLSKDEQQQDTLDNDNQYNNKIILEQNESSGYATQIQKPDPNAFTSPNLDWYEFTKEDNVGHTSSSVLVGLPTPSPTASENEASLFDDEDDDEDDNDDDQQNKIHEFGYDIDNDIINNHQRHDEPQIPFGFFSSDEEDDDDDDNIDDIDDIIAEQRLLLEASYCTSSSATPTMDTAPPPEIAPLRLPPPAKTATRSLKRKRSQSIDSITSCGSELEEEENDSPVLQRLHRLRLTEPKRMTTKSKSKSVAKRRTKRHPGRGRGVRPKTIACPAYDIKQQDEDDGIQRTIFERLTHSGIDWCRYCGTTEGVNWRPGPWGKRTLCNKHGCDYKGYGIASRLPRLDLSAFIHERLEDRRRPVVQQFCVVCQGPESNEDNKLVPCEGGCSRAYHQLCRIPAITSYQDQQWCCSTLCRENKKRNKVGPYDS